MKIIKLTVRMIRLVAPWLLKNYCSDYRDIGYQVECNTPWPRNDMCRFFEGEETNRCKWIGCALPYGETPCKSKRANEHAAGKP